MLRQAQHDRLFSLQRTRDASAPHNVITEQIIAHVVGRWQLARPAAGDLGGHFLLVFRRVEGRWVIVADHSS